MEMSPFLYGLYKLAKFLVYPYTWLFLWLGVLTLLVFSPTSPRRLRWIRVLSIASCFIVFIFGNSLGAGTLVGYLEEKARPFDPSMAREFDAIVVLGGGIRSQGTLRPTTELSAPSMRRTICGVSLYQQGWAPRLFLSGGDTSIFGVGPKESLEMKQLARRFGIPEEVIVVDTRSRTTYENAIEAKRLWGEANVLVVTSARHIPRALALFRNQGLEATGYPCGYESKNRPGEMSVSNPFNFIPGVWALSGSTQALNEFVGRFVYWLVGEA